MHLVYRPITSLAALSLLGALGCETPTPAEPTLAGDAVSLLQQRDERSDDVRLSAKGDGRYFLQNTFDVDFSFVAKQHSSGKVTGRFREFLVIDGQTVDFSGEVICMAVDLVNRRAWIGAVITSNRSTHPDFHQWYHQPGEDVWFRVVDYGNQDPAMPDRKTFMGFENTPGIPTSEVYCQLQIWPDGDARTWPVTQGDIVVGSTEPDDGDDD